MQENRETIKIVADDNDEFEIRGALPSVRQIAAQVHDVSSEILQENLSGLMQRCEAIVAGSMAAMDQLAIKEVKVAVAVNASGECSLLGLTKASADLHATFEITLVPKTK
ncbi:Pepco domain-containing protein [Bradyrhizobium pachyrhizi]|uniref:Pepco domain-containing protein n=1 Tax=Bradyrhizobium pachyrhizi TaxID=280333 RepID=UPI0012E35917|nr:hypothetical protein [Bradyrhizobium pachyrhizi]